MRTLQLFTLILFLATPCRSQDSTAATPNKKTALAVVSGAVAAGSIIWLQQAWYEQYNTGRFHFFDDASDWQQMDKAGHIFTTYQCGRLMMDAFRNSGFNRRQQWWIGGTSGLIYMTAIEVLDGFSRGWGFSWSDEASNVIGSAAVIAQDMLWAEQRVLLKYSYGPSGLAQYNPSLLGKNEATRLLKDYNGQSYWLTLTPRLFSKRHNKMPWLCISLGYSADGMLGGTSNNVVVTDQNGNVVEFERYRKLLLSLDVDLTKLPVKSKLLKKLLSFVNILKVPAPAVEYSRGQFTFHPLYF
jgi:hypothetical protein